MKKTKYHIAKYVPISDIVPEDWKGWFFEAISQNAPFSWGDNNRTLIDAISFGHHAEECIDLEDSFEYNPTIKKHRKKFFNSLTDLAKNHIYVDLEN